MRIVLAGLENPIELSEGECSTLEVENSALFARLARSFMSSEGRCAEEPYTIWDEDIELKPAEALLVIDNPLRLPWDERGLMGTIVKRMEREYLEDEDLRRHIEELQRSINAQLLSLELGMNADFGFSQEWDFKRYLKFAGFGVSYQEGKSFLDNLLNFLSLALDAGEKRAFIFVNLKTFLSENDFELFLEQVYFQKTKVFLLENKQDGLSFEHERKRLVDRDFIESW
ncbi:type II-A CRISPR-associated protein Csn2 [Olsenella sp. Marseille-P4559]|jgi:CRISPR-associated protein Csn2|uniref:type II-A CRISPR-associated protein Csn2 n=1 Tax=Olsenella sp. Marseille-P4559 TaxID=2364795 RepID=UPI0010300619|nr:type II-A CRISPR-associated protein Csn2 [Olsenella sp. Marseille-P4559]